MRHQMIIEFLILVVLVLLFVYIIQWRAGYIQKFENIDRQYENIATGIDDINNTMKQWELSE